MAQELVLVVGYPASGKTTITKDLGGNGHVRLNRDIAGGATVDLLPKLGVNLDAGKSVIMDNLFATRAMRAPFIEAAKKRKVPVKCVVLDTSIEDAQYNACRRMIERAGKLLMPEDHAKTKDPNLFPCAVLFKYRKEYEEPSQAEGFASIEKRKFVRKHDPAYTNKALLVDFDGCLRITLSGAKFPVRPDDIKILPNREEVLKKFQKAGYLLLGVSNQSGVAKGDLTLQDAQACFDATCKLLNTKIEVAFCHHKVPPISCYCRKPMPGLGVQFIEKHKLDPKACLMVGDMTTDKTFAARCGFRYCDAEQFFGGQWQKFLA
jgi:HAD superfamily hydrolase (TIGR01662 family)